MISVNLTEKFEIKVFILYLLKNLDEPLDYDTISEIVVQDGFVNFFDFADCFADLVDAGQIDAFFEGELPTYLISSTGREAVSNVETRLYNTVRDQALRSAQRLLALRKDGTDARQEDLFNFIISTKVGIKVSRMCYPSTS